MNKELFIVLIYSRKAQFEAGLVGPVPALFVPFRFLYLLL